MNKQWNTAQVWTCSVVMALAALSATGCWGGFSEQPPIHPNPNMDDQLYFETQESNALFAASDNRASRPMLARSVAAGTDPYGQTLASEGSATDPRVRYDDDWLAVDEGQMTGYYRGYEAPKGSFNAKGRPCTEETPEGETTAVCSAPGYSGQCVRMAGGLFCQPQTCTTTQACQDFTKVCDFNAMPDDPAVGYCRDKRYLRQLPSVLANQLDSKDAFARFLARGQQRFNIYCTPCHGETGGGFGSDGGHGIVPKRVPWNVPTYHDAQRRGYELGRLYDIVNAG